MKVQLKWNDNATDETSQRIYIKDGKGQDATILQQIEIAKDITSYEYTVPVELEGKAVWVTVTALKGDIESAQNSFAVTLFESTTPAALEKLAELTVVENGLATPSFATSKHSTVEQGLFGKEENYVLPDGTVLCLNHPKSYNLQTGEVKALHADLSQSASLGVVCPDGKYRNVVFSSEKGGVVQIAYDGVTLDYEIIKPAFAPGMEATWGCFNSGKHTFVLANGNLLSINSEGGVVIDTKTKAIIKYIPALAVPFDDEQRSTFTLDENDNLIVAQGVRDEDRNNTSIKLLRYKAVGDYAVVETISTLNLWWNKVSSVVAHNRRIYVLFSGPQDGNAQSPVPVFFVYSIGTDGTNAKEILAPVQTAPQGRPGFEGDYLGQILKTQHGELVIPFCDESYHAKAILVNPQDKASQGVDTFRIVALEDFVADRNGLDGGRAVIYKNKLYLNSYMGDLSEHAFNYGNISFSDRLAAIPVNGH